MGGLLGAARDEAGVAPAEGASPPLLTALTGIRALAATAVVVYHLRDALLALLPFVRWADPWLRYGFLGVDVFFVLSGFIISYNYAERFAQFGARTYRAYLRARFARIYPVYLVTLLMSAALVVYCRVSGLLPHWTKLFTGWGFLGNLAMLQALPGVQAWNTPSWSVSCEFAAYLVFPLAAGLLLRLRRAAAAVLAGVACVLLVIVIDGLSAVPEFSTAALFWVRIAAEFTLGCLLWAAWRHGIRPRPLWDLVGVGALLAAGLLLRFAAGTSLAWFAVGFFGLFVLAVASASGVLRAVLASRPLEYAGRISYSVYLAQAPASAIAFILLPYRLLALASLPVRLAAAAAYVLGPFLVGAVLYHLVEEPARTWLRGRRPPPVENGATPEAART